MFEGLQKIPRFWDCRTVGVEEEKDLGKGLFPFKTDEFLSVPKNQNSGQDISEVGNLQVREPVSMSPKGI